MSQKRKSHLIVLRLAAVLLVLTAISASMVTGRYARYTSSATVGASARVAKFEVAVSERESQAVPVTIQPGEDGLKYFTVVNSGEVAVALRFEVSNQYNNLPLEFLYPLSATVGPGETKDVPLRITWPVEDNDVGYTGMVDLIEISVQVEQVD